MLPFIETLLLELIEVEVLLVYLTLPCLSHSPCNIKAIPTCLLNKVLEFVEALLLKLLEVEVLL